MPRNKKTASQWDFGDLFAQAEARAESRQEQEPAPVESRVVISVGQLTSNIRSLLEQQIGSIWVRGEVTNLRLQQQSGHMYFTLKDEKSQLNCVFFRRANARYRDLVDNGRMLLVHGAVSVYEPRGQYQLIVDEVEPEGIGALQAAFEKLKRKLEAEGLFAPERKRPIPEFPQRIGLVTSPTGAAIRDVLHVVNRRFPGLEIVLAPSRVQGDGAGDQIAQSIERLNDWSATQPAGRQLDLILITRGGGSLEDLWAFNEEVVARAVGNSSLPVVSAVGHEIDFSISDFVADLRAATPSAAAELLTEKAFATRQWLFDCILHLQRRVHQVQDSHKESLVFLAHRLKRCHPRRQLDEHFQQLDELQSALLRNVSRTIQERVVTLGHLQSRLRSLQPGPKLRLLQTAVDDLSRRYKLGAHNRLRLLQSQLQQLENSLHHLSPQNILNRGYSITTSAKTGRIIRSHREVHSGTEIQTRIRDGQVYSTVTGAVSNHKNPAPDGDSESPQT